MVVLTIKDVIIRDNFRNLSLNLFIDIISLKSGYI